MRAVDTIIIRSTWPSGAWLSLVCATAAMIGCSDDDGEQNQNGNHNHGPVCGNGIREATEACDGTDLGGATCASLGVGQGTLICESCEYDTTACTTCGDGACSTGENSASCADDCGVTDIQAYFLTTCAGLRDGSARCWGAGSAGQLGNGELSNRVLHPAPVVIANEVVSLSVGSLSGCAITESGELWCWGSSSLVGTGIEYPSPVPLHVSLLDDVTQVDVGQESACALTTAGLVSCWGLNSYHTLGSSTLVDVRVPVLVEDLNDVVRLSLSGGHVCVVKTEGSVWCWGHEWMGELGDGGQETYSDVPLLVDGLTDASDVACGGGFTCAVDRAGRVFCLGTNTSGILGTSSLSHSFAPVEVPGLPAIRKLAAGSDQLCAIDLDAALWCWGGNRTGQLGLGYTSDSNAAPHQLSELAEVESVSPGYQYTCAVLANGSAYCWGDNVWGQLGTGDLEPRHSPTAVVGL